MIVTVSLEKKIMQELLIYFLTMESNARIAKPD